MPGAKKISSAPEVDGKVLELEKQNHNLQSKIKVLRKEIKDAEEVADEFEAEAKRHQKAYQKLQVTTARELENERCTNRYLRKVYLAWGVVAVLAAVFLTSLVYHNGSSITDVLIQVYSDGGISTIYKAVM